MRNLGGASGPQGSAASGVTAEEWAKGSVTSSGSTAGFHPPASFFTWKIWFALCKGRSGRMKEVIRCPTSHSSEQGGKNSSGTQRSSKGAVKSNAHSIKGLDAKGVRLTKILSFYLKQWADPFYPLFLRCTPKKTQVRSHILSCVQRHFPRCLYKIPRLEDPLHSNCTHTRPSSHIPREQKDVLCTTSAEPEVTHSTRFQIKHHFLHVALNN